MRRRNWKIRSLALVAAMVMFLSCVPLDAITEQLISDWFQLNVELEPEEAPEPEGEEPAEDQEVGLVWTFGEEKSVYLSAILDDLDLTLDSLRTLNVQVSDSELVSLRREVALFFYDWRITAKDYFDEAELIVSTYRTRYAIRLRNPAPILPGETVETDQGSFTPLSPVPAGTTLIVDSYQPNENEINQIILAAGEKAELVWLDLGLFANDQKVEAGAAVTINTEINLPEPAVLSGLSGTTVLQSVRLFHFMEDGSIEELVAKPELKGNVINSVSFTADSFSPFVIAYTVKFEYEGGEYVLPGEGSVYLQQLLQRLNLIDSLFPGGYEPALVESVVFSSPDLVAVIDPSDQVDWKLQSLGAFSTVETLTLKLLSGETIVIRVTDDQMSTSDISQMFVELRLNGDPVDPSKPFTIHENEEFSLGLFFAETRGVDGKQFVNDDTPMVYTLPAGVELTKIGDLGEVDITVVDAGRIYTVTGNKVSYDPTTRQLSLVLNKDDPHFARLTASADASAEIHIICKFTVPTGSTVKFGDNYEITLSEPSDAGVEKTAEYGTFTVGDPPASQGLVKYQVKVKADGNIPAEKPVNIKDVISGEALTLASEYGVTWESTEESRDVNTVTTTISEDRKSFISDITGMSNGEYITYTYYARVDTSKLAGSGNTTFDEAGNTVTLTNPGNETDDPRNNVDTATPPIDFEDLKKKHQLAEELLYDGDRVYRRIDWTITANEEHKITHKNGDTITDYIDFYSSNIPMYYGDSTGIHVKKISENGSTVSEFDKTWAQLGITDTTSVMKKGKENPIWTYTIDSNDNDAYIITYSTYVNVAEMSSWDDLTNYVVSPTIGSYIDTVPVGPTGDGDTIVVRKNLLYADTERCEWEIEVDVRSQGYDQQFLVTDVIPLKWINNVMYKDSLISWELLSELAEGEFYEGRLEKNQWSADRLQIEFYKMVNGEKVPGLAAVAEDRTLKFKVTTGVNQEWLDVSTNMQSNAAWVRQHINKADARAEYRYFGTDTAAVTLAKKVMKKELANSTMDRNSRFVTIDGVEYPLYRFHTVLTGFEGNEGQDIVFEDTFDTSRFRLYYMTNELASTIDASDWRSKWSERSNRDNVEVHFSDSPYWANNDPDYQPANYTLEETSDGFKVTIRNEDILMRKSSSGFYSAIHLVYWLIANGPEGLEKVKSDAAADLGRAEYINTATAGGLDPVTAKFDYAYKPISKSYVSDELNQNIEYTVSLNPGKVTMNGGQPIEVKDTHSENLSIKYDTIHVVSTDPAGRESQVTWDYRGNTGTFQIPDGTSVVISYVADVIDKVDEDTPAWNKIEMLGYEETVSDSKFPNFSATIPETIQS